MVSGVVRAAEASDAEGICSLLHSKMNPKIPIELWRRLMTYKWLDEKPDFGRVVEADGQILGYCGMVYSDRLIGDANHMRPERMVSMSSWYLDKSLRGQGLGRDMLISSISDPTLTYVILTNSSKPLAIVKALGFQVLEDHRYVWRKSDSSHAGVGIIKDVESIKARINSNQQKLIDDMHGYALTPLLVELDAQQSLLFFSIKRKAEDVLWYDLMYASDQALFANCAQVLANQLLPSTAAVLASDGRFVQQPPPGIVSERLPVGRHYISERVARNEIDHLYSELQLLDLKLD